MIARKRVDITASDALRALVVHNFFSAAELERRREALEQHWWQLRAPHHAGALVLLSVRTAFDVFLRALELPEGAVVLMSAVTIADMAAVVEQNGLVPVPVDLDPRTMAPSVHDVERLLLRLGRRVRVVCVAHLLGTVVDLAPIVDVAHRHGTLVFEDCAQAFCGSVPLARTPGAPAVNADCTAWSFGLIKTAAAVGGAIVTVRDAALLARVRKLAAALPRRDSAAYAGRLKTAAFVSFALRPLPFRLLWAALQLFGSSMDEFLLGLTKAFPGQRVVDLVRFAPEGSLAWLMDRRIRAFDEPDSPANQHLRRRIAVGKRVCDGLASVDGLLVAGIDEVERGNHSFWLFGVFVEPWVDKQALIHECNAAGFDVTAGSSQLVAVPVPAGIDDVKVTMAEWMARFLFVPALPEMSFGDADRLVSTVRRALQRQRGVKLRAKL